MPWRAGTPRLGGRYAMGNAKFEKAALLSGIRKNDLDPPCPSNAPCQRRTRRFFKDFLVVAREATEMQKTELHGDPCYRRVLRTSGEQGCADLV